MRWSSATPRRCAITSAASSAPMPELRAATEADLPRIAALARWVWLDSYADAGVSASFAAYLEQAFSIETLRASLRREPMWLIEEGEQLQAWAELDSTGDGQLELTKLYVAPPCHGRGLGAPLLLHLPPHPPPRAAVGGPAGEGKGGALRFPRREGPRLIGEGWFELEGQRHRNERLGWA